MNIKTKELCEAKFFLLLQDGKGELFSKGKNLSGSTDECKIPHEVRDFLVYAETLKALSTGEA